MNKETLRMQLLSGVITESEYKAKLEEIGMFNDPIGYEKSEPNPKDKIFTKEYKGNGMYVIYKNGKEVKTIEGEGNANAWINDEMRKLKENKKSLNENFVGMGMVGNIFDREKTDYELAFEHFTKGTSLNEDMEDEMPEAPSHEETDAAQVYEEMEDEFEDEDENEFDLNQTFKDSPETAPYDEVLDIVDSYGDYATLDAFQGTFSEDEEVSKKDYFKFFSNYIDDMSDVDYIKANWISIFDEDIYDKAGLYEAKKPGTFKQRSAMAKKARAGKDIGKKGKTFAKIAKSAGEKYGSEEAGKRVAGAVMYGKLGENEEELEEAMIPGLYMELKNVLFPYYTDLTGEERVAMIDDIIGELNAYIRILQGEKSAK